MAYTVQNGDILECTIKGTLDAQVVMSVFHYRLDMPVGTLDGVATINSFNTKWNAGGPDGLVRPWAGAVSAQTRLDEITYQWVSAIRRARQSRTPVEALGLVVGTASPPNIACAISKTTDVATRRGLGTLHMPGIVNESFLQGRFTPAGRALYDDLVLQIPHVVNLDFGQNMTPLVFNRATPDLSVPITGALTRLTVRTMHRRTVGVGE
jgi:hypothetical protein